MTPEEAWSGIKPSIEYFRVFGCISHVHVPDSKRTKLDDKSQICVLLGEDKSWDWDKKYEEAIACDLEWGDREEKVVEIDRNVGMRLSEEEVQLAMFAAADPIRFDDAVKSEKWRKAMDVEIEAIKRNNTWELTELLEGGKKIGVKWVYKTKFNKNGEVDKYKARLVVKGYSQQHGVDYTEVFAPVARMETIRLPLGYVKNGYEHKVYKLKKALYGLKQAPRAWYSRIEVYFLKEGFEKCDYEHTLFIKTGKESKLLIRSLYVDDLIFTGNDELMVLEFKSSMKHEFDMTHLGKMRYFLGLEILQNSRGCKLMKDESGVKVDKIYFKQIVGSLMYLTTTQPDVMFVVGLISRYMENPTELHLQVAKRVLRYLKGTLDFRIFYKNGGNNELIAYTDSDYAGDLEDRKSTSVWLKRVLDNLGLKQGKTTSIQCDSNSAIKLSKNPVMHGRSKHIDVRFHFLRELTKAGTVELVYCNTQEQLADVMTKPLKLDVFLKLRASLGVCSETDESLNMGSCFVACKLQKLWIKVAAGSRKLHSKLESLAMANQVTVASGLPDTDKRQAEFGAVSIQNKNGLPDMCTVQVTVASGLRDSKNQKSGFGAPWKGLDSEILKPGVLGGVDVGGDCRTTMRVFLQALDYELWEIVCDGSFIPRKNVLSELDKKNMSLNFKAMNALFCALDKKEFHRVSNCSNAYEIWRKLEIVYEETTSEEEFHKVSNLALMTIGDESDDELDEVNDLPTYDELHDAFKELHDEWMKLGKKNACLKKKMLELTNEKDTMQKCIDSLNEKIKELELENKTLHDEVALSNEKFSTSHKHLESYVDDLKNENDALQKCNGSLNEKIKGLELDNKILHDRIASFKCKQSTLYEHEKSHIDELINENETLKKRSIELNEIVLKFTNGQKMLDNMLNSQKCVFDKGGLGYKPYLK
ncbi:Integrase catalytic domain-containing protein [Citrus sinensis]|nr:Integrase catalytic domain-containing protein [Citrus sinensis]